MKFCMYIYGSLKCLHLQLTKINVRTNALLISYNRDCKIIRDHSNKC
jgi:hypothetical protein